LKACCRGGSHIYFLDSALSNIGDVEKTRLRIESITPRVAQAIGPDFATPAGLAGEWI